MVDDDPALVTLKDEYSVESVVETVNELLQTHQIELLQNAVGKIVYKTILPEEQAKFKGLSSDDILVYRVVKSAGSQGIWTKDIKTRYGFQGLGEGGKEREDGNRSDKGECDCRCPAGRTLRLPRSTKF